MKNGDRKKFWEYFFLTNVIKSLIIYKHYIQNDADVAQLVERLIRNQKVAGSNPAIGFFKYPHYFLTPIKSNYLSQYFLSLAKIQSKTKSKKLKFLLDIFLIRVYYEIVFKDYHQSNSR